MMHKGVTASVGDIITACANVKGGIHLSAPRGKRATQQKAVSEADEMHVSFGSPPSIHAAAGICEVALRGLYPLVAAIQNRGGLGGA